MGPSETKKMRLRGRLAVDGLRAALSAATQGLGIVIAPAARKGHMLPPVSSSEYCLSKNADQA
ncbi:hypothetical protein ACVIKO_006095 [Rhizobium ruizarguesonis]